MKFPDPDQDRRRYLLGSRSTSGKSITPAGPVVTKRCDNSSQNRQKTNRPVMVEVVKIEAISCQHDPPTCAESKILNRCRDSRSSERVFKGSAQLPVRIKDSLRSPFTPAGSSQQRIPDFFCVPYKSRSNYTVDAAVECN